MSAQGTVQVYKRYSGVDDRTYWYADYACDSAGSRVTARLGDTVVVRGTEKQLCYLADQAFRAAYQQDYQPKTYEIET